MVQRYPMANVEREKEMEGLCSWRSSRRTSCEERVVACVGAARELEQGDGVGVGVVAVSVGPPVLVPRVAEQFGSAYGGFKEEDAVVHCCLGVVKLLALALPMQYCFLRPGAEGAVWRLCNAPLSQEGFAVAICHVVGLAVEGRPDVLPACVGAGVEAGGDVVLPAV
eukprot:2709680-Rhodomonas_salina.1